MIKRDFYLNRMIHQMCKKESSELASLILTKDFFKKIIVRKMFPIEYWNLGNILL